MGRSLIDVKGVGKPTTFKGEEGKFQSWASKTAFYFNGVYPGGKSILQYCEQQADPIDPNDLSLQFPGHVPVLAEMNEGLYTLLGCNTEDDAQTIILNAPEGDGFECWRRLSRRYDLRTVARNRAMLAEIMKAGEVKVSELLSSIENLEKKITVYEQRKKAVLDDELKIGAILNMVPKSIRDHVDLNSAAFTTYAQVRQLIVSYTENQVSTAMDVSAIGKGGKGTGKGTDAECYNCGKKGHYAKDCRAPKKDSKGSGKDGKGSKGKGGKGGGGKPSAHHAQASSSNDSNKKCKHCKGTSRELSHWTSECKYPQGKPGGKGSSKGVNSVDEAATASSDSTSALFKEFAAFVSSKKAPLQLQLPMGSVDIRSLGSVEVVREVSAVNLHPLEPVSAQVQSDVDRMDGYACEKIKAGLDSGAAVSVCPRNFATDYPVLATRESEMGQEFRVANGETIRNEGLVQPIVVTDSGIVRKLELTKTDVHKILLAAGKLVRNKHIVHLEEDNCYVQDKVTGEILPVIHEPDDTFSMEFNVVPKAELSAIIKRSGIDKGSERGDQNGGGKPPARHASPQYCCGKPQAQQHKVEDSKPPSRRQSHRL